MSQFKGKICIKSNYTGWEKVANVHTYLMCLLLNTAKRQVKSPKLCFKVNRSTLPISECFIFHGRTGQSLLSTLKPTTEALNQKQTPALPSKWAFTQHV